MQPLEKKKTLNTGLNPVMILMGMDGSFKAHTTGNFSDAVEVLFNAVNTPC